jgi:SAM-dependent methyltransferase
MIAPDDKRTRMQNHFNELAEARVEYRKSKAYYWDSISQYCDFFIHEDESVLEIGCGTGELLASVKGRRKVGIDFSSKMIERAREQFPELDFRPMEAERLQLDETFDVVILSHTIGYLDDILLVFKQLHSVCHERTRIIVSYYNYLWEPLIKLAERLGLKKRTPHQGWLSSRDIANLLYLAKFDVYRHSRRMLFPYRVPFISTFLNRFLAKLPLLNRLALNEFVFARPAKQTSDRPREQPSVSVVIPARNEAGNIEEAILRMPQFGSRQEIIFVEGNSTDDTWDRIQQVREKYGPSHDIKIAQQEGEGKGDAVRKGYDMATGDVLMILDADLTVPPEDLPEFYDALISGRGEFINGCRLVYPLEDDAMRPLNVLGNKFFSMAFSWILEQPVKDTLCGTKVMYRSDYIKLAANREFFGDFDPFGDFDLIFGAYKLNLKLVDLPVR